MRPSLLASARYLLAATALSAGLTSPVAAQDAAPAAVATASPTAFPATSLTGATASPAIPLGQLPGTVTPSGYRIDLTIDPRQERFSGKVEIDATLKTTTDRVFLHGRALTMQQATARVGRRSFTGTWRQVESTGVAELVFTQPLPAGPMTFAFAYDGPFGNTASGLHRVKVGDDWYSWTQFESIDARAAFPSFDEPGFKVPFTVTLRTPPGQFATSNAPQLSLKREGAYDVHRFAPTLPLPTYLVAFVVGPFMTLDGTVPPTAQRSTPLPLRIVATKPNADKMQFALTGSEQIVARLENYFGQPFPFPKLDQIGSPVMSGAMENAGADIYGDPILLLDDQASVGRKRAFGMVVAHELAHQWFGDLVTPAWWNDIWLNESFANWMGYRIGNEWRPDLNIAAGAVNEAFRAMDTDALPSGRPIRETITTNNQIDAAFDTITYGKGGQVVAMIAAFMGDTRFRDGVRSYMAAHPYGNATSAEFFGAMAKVSGDPRILPAMQSFTDQQGVPLVTFAANGPAHSSGSAGSYTVTQSRYALLGTQPAAARWGIPLCVRRGGERECSLMAEPTMPLQVGGSGPLMPNAGGTGYYRFELPASDWDGLIAQADRLPAGEALALADSLDASFRAGRSNMPRLIALAKTLVRNPDSYASDQAIETLSDFARTGIIADSAQPAWRAFVARTYAPRLAELGFDPRTGAYVSDDPGRSARRTRVVSALVNIARDPALGAQLGVAAKARLAGDMSALDPVWYGPGMGITVTDGGLPAAQALVEAALKSEDVSFRAAALGAAARSGKPEVAQWLLSFDDPRLRAREKIDLRGDIVRNKDTTDVGYRWLRENLDTVLADMSGIFATRTPDMLSDRCSVADADTFAAELLPRFVNTPGELEMRRVIDRVRSCGTLKTARSAEVTAAVAKLR